MLHVFFQLFVLFLRRFILTFCPLGSVFSRFLVFCRLASISCFTFCGFIFFLGLFLFTILQLEIITWNKITKLKHSIGDVWQLVEKIPTLHLFIGRGAPPPPPPKFLPYPQYTTYTNSTINSKDLIINISKTILIPIPDQILDTPVRFLIRIS